MQDLLFLCHRIPYPPDKGDKIRSYHILEFLRQRFRVHLACFVDDPADVTHIPTLENLCATVFWRPIDPKRAKIKAMTGFLKGEPLNLPYFRDRAMARWIRDHLLAVKPDAAFLYSSAIGQYLVDPPYRPRRLIMDFMDVDSDKWRQYADTQKWPMSWVYRRESRELLAYDRTIGRIADANTFVSETEAALWRQLAPESAEKTFGVSNGIDFETFAPDQVGESPYSGDGPVLAFTGAMDYWPNVDAVVWFAKDILPRIRTRIPNAQFAIVGRNPTAEVSALAGRDGVLVTGTVADVRAYVAHATVSVSPIRIARGIQNKVLEAMAMARPVVTSPQALEGIAAEPDRDLLLADGAEAFADAVVRAIEDPALAGLGEQARRHVVAHYSWQATLAKYDDLLA